MKMAWYFIRMKKAVVKACYQLKWRENVREKCMKKKLRNIGVIEIHRWKLNRESSVCVMWRRKLIISGWEAAIKWNDESNESYMSDWNEKWLRKYLRKARKWKYVSMLISKREKWREKLILLWRNAEKMRKYESWPGCNENEGRNESWAYLASKLSWKRICEEGREAREEAEKANREKAVKKADYCESVAKKCESYVWIKYSLQYWNENIWLKILKYNVAKYNLWL